MKVSDYMTTPVVVMDPSEPISRARNLMFKHDLANIVIVEDDTPMGILTRGDISRRLDTQGPMWRRRPIDRVPVHLVMTRGLITIYPSATVQQAAELLVENDIGALPVVKDEDLVGIIDRVDLVQAFIDMETGLKAGDIMMSYVVTVHRHHTLAHVLERMDEEAVEWVVVMEDDDTPVGLIDTHHLALVRQEDQRGDLPRKEIDMTRKLKQGGERRARYVVESPMVAEDVMLDLESVGVDESASKAAEAMLEGDLTAIPVVDEDDRIAGTISRRDVIEYVMKMEG